jgi:hypothetical protein
MTPPGQSDGAALDSGVRTFTAVGYTVTVKPGDSWITVRGRGGHLMMASEREVAEVARLIEIANDYARGGS